MKSIRTKLWLGMMVLVGMIMIILWLFQIVFLDKFYSVLEIGAVQKYAESISTQISTFTNINQIKMDERILEKLDAYIYEKQVAVEIIDSDNQAIYQGTSGNNGNLSGVMQEAFSEVSQSALNGEKTRQKVTHPKYGYEFMMMGIPIQNKNSGQSALIVTMPMASLDETVSILKGQLIIITGILLVVSLLMSYILSKKIAAPISKISRQVDCYAKGEYQIRTKNEDDDEIGKLARQMNIMGEALVRNDLLQKELIANVSHELRTPLTLIRGYAETLRDVTGSDPVKREAQLDIIIEESRRLGNIVEDILNLSRLQAGAATLMVEEFSLKEMLFSMKNHFGIDENGRKLELVGVETLEGNVKGDENKIRQVFYNLIGNALHHSYNDQTVFVAVTPQEKKMRIEVRDQGQGIAKEDLEHVFERYYKGKRIDGQSSEGTGLGLAIVKSILDMHNVLYGVESEIDKGTVFWFELEKADSHTSF